MLPSALTSDFVAGQDAILTHETLTKNPEELLHITGWRANTEVIFVVVSEINHLRAIAGHKARQDMVRQTSRVR